MVGLNSQSVSLDMKLKQKLLKRVYPTFIWVTKFLRMQSQTIKSPGKVTPPQSFYDLSVTLNTGQLLPCSDLRNMKVLIVNTASDCGYTAQYDDLQKLYTKFADQLVIIGFPSNDFKEQEKGTDEEIATFCKINFGVSFPLAKKCSVLKGIGQNEIFQWLTTKEMNGWNEQEPTWNFSKYLIDEKGRLTHYFDPSVVPGEGDI